MSTYLCLLSLNVIITGREGNPLNRTHKIFGPLKKEVGFIDLDLDLDFSAFH